MRITWFLASFLWLGSLLIAQAPPSLLDAVHEMFPAQEFETNAMALGDVDGSNLRVCA